MIFPLRWAAGKHPYDGAWADAWYQKVYLTTGLETYTPSKQTVALEHQGVLEECLGVYAEIHAHRITNL